MSRLLALSAALLLAPVAFAADDPQPQPKPGQRGNFDRAKLFEVMDADADGKVTKNEFKKGMETVAAKMKERGAAGRGGAILEKLGGQIGEKLFEKLDADSDGKLSKAEFEKFELDPTKLKDLRGKIGPGKGGV